jgi:hypothetical protein
MHALVIAALAIFVGGFLFVFLATVAEGIVDRIPNGTGLGIPRWCWVVLAVALLVRGTMP